MDGQVQDYIEQLERDGFAYGSAGSVYFDIDGFTKKGFCYRKLMPCAHTSAAEMEEGEGALAATDGDKRNPNDFALWKKSKPGEPAWESKWGPGRPGWHIECSVMACHIMKEYLDIHAGGEDLKFPHHDNEMAQSEAYLNRKQWVNYFWHAGHLHIEGLKMSKSLKNFITIRQAMEFHTARQLRMMFLMQQWDRGMNYSDDAIGMAKAEERKMKHVVGCLKFFKRKEHSKAKAGDREKALLAALDECKEAVDKALKANFNTSKAIEEISKLLGNCYPSFDALPEAQLDPVSKICDFVMEIMGIFGVENLSIVPDKEAAWIPALDAFADLREDVRQLARAKAGNDKVAEAIARAKPAAAAASSAGLGALATAFNDFMKDLAGCKEAKDLLRRCDQVRDKDFVDLGVRLEDRGTAGFVWMFEDTKTMVREAQEAEEKKAEAQKAKVQRSLEEKRKTLTLAEKAAVRPAELLKSGGYAGLYKDFDASGMPSKTASGEEISKSKVKDLKKDLTKQEKEFEKLQKQAGDQGIDAYLAKLRKEVSDIEAQLR
jgi:cysteinyl-tRNA synthetase